MEVESRMLFLLNTTLIEIESPEIHLRQCWRRLGCADPVMLSAADAIDVVQHCLSGHLRYGTPLDEVLAKDLAALIISKTGANALTFRTTSRGTIEPRLRHLPRLVMETYWNGAANDRPALVALGQRLRS